MTVIADTTSPVYWLLIAMVALALLVTMLIRGIPGMLWKLLAVMGTCVTAGAFAVAYGVLGGA